MNITNTSPVTISSSWNPTPTSGDATKVNGVTHTVFNSALASFMGKGKSITEGAPATDQLDKTLGTNPTIGAIECTFIGLTPTITTASPQNMERNKTSLTIEATVKGNYSDNSAIDIGTGSYTLKWSDNPAGFSINENTGALTTTTAANLGSNTVKVKVTATSGDKISGETSKDITINVYRKLTKLTPTIAHVNFDIERGKFLTLTATVSADYSDGTKDEALASNAY